MKLIETFPNHQFVVCSISKKWDKVLKSGLSKFCVRLLLKKNFVKEFFA